MYAVDNNGRLMTIDLDTAVGTWVGLSPSGVYGVSSLAYSSSDGYLYAGQSGHTPSHLFRIDPATGATTTVGQVDFISGFGYTSGLAYDPLSGLLFATSLTGASKLYTIDPATAASALVGDTGFAYVSGLTYDPAGVLYGVTEPYGEPTLIAIDPQTGAGSAIGPTDVGMFGLAYVIPEPASLLLFAAGLGAVARRRRKR